MFPHKNERSLLLWTVPGYVIAVVVWFFVWLWAGDVTWWLIVLNRYVPFLFLPVPLLLGWVILVRRYQLAVLLMIPLTIFVAFYHPYVIPQPARTDIQPKLKVLTYNVLFSNSDYDAVANVILAYQPDFVALQEVQPATMAALERRLADDYPYALMGFAHPYGTTAVFSRHPLQEAYVLDLQTDRPAVVVKSEVAGTPVTFISAHLLAYGLWWVKLRDMPDVIVQRTAAQNRQAQLLVEEIQDHEGIVILGCDCNSKETASSYRILVRAMTNAARASGRQMRAEAVVKAKQDTSLQHIDYIFYRGNLEPLRVYTIQDSGGSDHWPVLTLFDF